MKARAVDNFVLYAFSLAFQAAVLLLKLRRFV
jgi:hypothetical protein